MPGELTIVYVSVEREIAAMTTVAEELERLDKPARERIMRWAWARYVPMLFEPER